MSEAFEKKLAEWKKRHGHQIQQSDDTPINKDILISGMEVCVRLEFILIVIQNKVPESLSRSHQPCNIQDLFSRRMRWHHKRKLKRFKLVRTQIRNRLRYDIYS